MLMYPPVRSQRAAAAMAAALRLTTTVDPVQRRRLARGASLSKRRPRDGTRTTDFLVQDLVENGLGESISFMPSGFEGTPTAEVLWVRSLPDRQLRATTKTNEEIAHRGGFGSFCSAASRWTHSYLLYHYTCCIFPSYRPVLLSLICHSASIDLNSILRFS